MLLSNTRSLKLRYTCAFIAFGIIFYFLQGPIWPPDNGRSAGGLFASPTTRIPEKIWYKLGPKGLSDQSKEWIDTCLKKNPAYQREFLTDASADAWVRTKFAYRPDIVELYLALPIPILKADLLRYLLLFAEGGIWSDLDVSCGDTPIGEWIPETYRKNASLVVGWEFQTVDEKHVREFATWTIMAKPGLRHMSMVINDTVNALKSKAVQHNVTVANLKMDMIGDVVWLTGPMAMSKSIIKSLGVEKENINMGTTPYRFEPVLIEDVLILPGYSFSASLQQYKPGENPGPALVTHHFAGSWKNNNGGEVAGSGS
ncbi:hypothetical protein B0O99DRAFT_524153 [Bisporella sp. PMI_857]|nr:hypothetical protein B0O99DRAFT_524153 [Bisporella sp. PMI_857]